MVEPGTTPAEAPPEELYDQLREPMVRYLGCMGLDRSSAEDVVHEAFVRLQTHLAGGGDQSNLRAWLFRVAHNEARNRSARVERRRAVPLDEGLAVVARGANPERRVLEAEKMGKLRRALESLGDAERECIFLRSQGLRYREMGEVLGLPTSTVADLVSRAVRKLAEKCNV